MTDDHVTLADIELSTKRFAAAHQLLTDDVMILNDEQAALKRRHLPGIKRAVEAVREQRGALKLLIEAAPDHFLRPRTLVFHGIKVGYRKGAGGIEWEEDARVIHLIRKHFPEFAEALIKTTEKPSIKGLQELDVSDLRKIGCTVESTGDVVVIKPTASDVDKIVTALMREETAE